MSLSSPLTSAAAAVSLTPVAPAPQELGFLTINGKTYRVTLENGTLPTSTNMAEVLQKIHMIAKTQLQGVTGNVTQMTITRDQTTISKTGTTGESKANTNDVADFTSDDAFTNDKFQSRSSTTETSISLSSYNTLKGGITTTSGTKCSDVFNSIFPPAPSSSSGSSSSRVGVGGGGSLLAGALGSTTSRIGRSESPGRGRPRSGSADGLGLVGHLGSAPANLSGAHRPISSTLASSFTRGPARLLLAPSSISANSLLLPGSSIALHRTADEDVGSGSLTSPLGHAHLPRSRAGSVASTASTDSEEDEDGDGGDALTDGSSSRRGSIVEEGALGVRLETVRSPHSLGGADGHEGGSSAPSDGLNAGSLARHTGASALLSSVDGSGLVRE